MRQSRSLLLKSSAPGYDLASALINPSIPARAWDRWLVLGRMVHIQILLHLLQNLCEDAFPPVTYNLIRLDDLARATDKRFAGNLYDPFGAHPVIATKCRPKPAGVKNVAAASPGSRPQTPPSAQVASQYRERFDGKPPIGPPRTLPLRPRISRTTHLVRGLSCSSVAIELMRSTTMASAGSSGRFCSPRGPSPPPAGPP